VQDRCALDRWALSESARLARDVDAALEVFDTQRAGRLIAEHIDALSNWYVRRSRRRFWRGEPDALQTLHECLRTVTLVMAPLTPFVTERVWQDLFVATSDAELASVHLAAWPTDDAAIDEGLGARMSIVRRVVELGRAARAESGVKTRQPLARALVASADWAVLEDELREQIADELNVVDVQGLDASGDLVDVTVKANFRALGKRFGKRTPEIAAAVTAADPVALVAGLRAGTASVLLGDETVTLGEEDLVITETPREGWAVASDDGVSCALDLALDDTLLRAGLARDLVRAVQEARKRSGLDITDRIDLVWSTSDPSARAALLEHADQIAAEVLAITLAEGDPHDGLETRGGTVVPIEDPPVVFGLIRAATN
jgi:isoleucyl-tRNA synthetase